MEVIWTGTMETASIKAQQIHPEAVAREERPCWLDEVCRVIRRRPLTMPEIAERLAIDQGTVNAVIYRLKREGKVTHGPDLRRSRNGRLCRTYQLLR